MLVSCTASHEIFSKKYAPAALQRDATIAWETYRSIHPSYNWYNSTENVDAAFKHVIANISDSLTEAEFRRRLSVAVAAIQCGHTSVSPSKAYSKARAYYRLPDFPFPARVWGTDSIVVVASRSKRDSPMHRGDAVLNINNHTSAAIIADMLPAISSDGFNNTFREQIISGNFGARYHWHYGYDSVYNITLADSTGKMYKARFAYRPEKRRDSVVKQQPSAPSVRRQRPSSYGTFTIDSTRQFATLDLPTFSERKSRGLIRRSFKKLQHDTIPNLVIDLRSNTGGRIGRSTLLSRYVADHSFRVADSVSAKSFRFPYTRYVRHGWFHRYLLRWLAHKENDDRYHIRSLERKSYKPHRNAFKGDVYVLTTGYTFSASLLFINAVYGQKNVQLVGEETGGGLRGNSAVMTPNFILPNTKIKLRLPLYRIVTNHRLPHIGRGAMPDITVPYNSANLRYRVDAKMEAILNAIAAKNACRTKN